MTTPARRHFQRYAAASAAAAAGEDMEGDVYMQHLKMLHEDKAQLSAIRSIAAREDVKRALLPKYQPYIAGVLEHGNGANDQVLATVLLWSIDAGDIAGALPMAEYAIKHGLAAPDAHARTNAEILAEESVTKLMDGDDGISADNLELLEHIEALVAGEDLVDQVRAKLHKALGRANEEAGHDEAAIEQYRKALSAHSKCGCKRLLDELERRIKKTNDQPKV